MELVLTPEQLEQISQHCQQAYPWEGCGMLLGHWADGRKLVAEVLPTGNAREESARHNRYLIPPEELLGGELEAEERGLEVIGYFHSHPDHPASPSECDRKLGWPWYSYLIVAVHGGLPVSHRSWQLREDRSAFDEEQVVILSPGKD